MRRLKMVSVVVALALAASPASGELYDFDEIPSSGPLGTAYTEAAFNGYFSGVYFDNIGADGFQVVSAADLGLGFSGNAISNRYFVDPKQGWVQGTSTVATFDVPVTCFSVTMGDLGGDEDYLYLIAYDTGGNSLPVVDDYIPQDSNASRTLSVTGANIAKVEFCGRDSVGSNSVVYWDNVCFTPVPVPGAAVLGMLGLGAAGLRLRKRSA